MTPGLESPVQFGQPCSTAVQKYIFDDKDRCRCWAFEAGEQFQVQPYYIRAIAKVHMCISHPSNTWHVNIHVCEGLWVCGCAPGALIASAARVLSVCYMRRHYIPQHMAAPSVSSHRLPIRFVEHRKSTGYCCIWFLFQWKN